MVCGKPNTKAGRRAARVLVAMLSVMLVITMMPTNWIDRAYAEPEATAGTEGSPAFSQQVEADGNLITVEAPEGVFPADATLDVSKITDETILAKAEEAVDKKREKGMNDNQIGRYA